YDRNRVNGADLSTLSDLGLAQSGAASGIDGTATYIRRGGHAHFQGTAGASFQEFAASNFSGGTYFGQAQVGADLTRRIVLAARAGASHTPFYQFAPGLAADPSSAVPLTPGYGVAAVAEPNTSVDGSLSLTDNFSRRSFLMVEGHWSQTGFRNVGRDA